MNSINYEIFNFLATRGIVCLLFLILSFMFLDTIRLIQNRAYVKYYFAALTSGCFGVSMHVITNPIPEIYGLCLFLLGLGLIPLCKHRVRYNT